jgi:hypothetical protein
VEILTCPVNFLLACVRVYIGVSVADVKVCCLLL